MLQVTSRRPLTKQEETVRKIYKKNSFPNGAESYWIKFKLNEGDARFFHGNKVLIIKFDQELSKLDNEYISALNEWKVTKQSYANNLEKMCEELNFFEVLYDPDGELISALFRIKYLIDVDNVSFTLNNFDAFKDMCYKTIFTQSMKDKITLMIEENYVDDIEAENLRQARDRDMLSINNIVDIKSY